MKPNMAKNTNSTKFFLAFLMLFLLLANSEFATAKLCQRRSETWSGPCGSTDNCDRQCRKWEHAVHGACHGFISRACYCYFNC
ncbi:Defensin-like protein [Actinidia chinensis var. chinensis]|uniref:Defensin-like protein n=1 Tax=Actinidia chinensis var. chinensis TaxID=1590841 RepID=A0A2R6R1M4_ACTCC|nr:Defensin-like protein [Actinidia chinensis var. chinensis]